jgi:lipopolysaccharide transport system permease protein
MICHPFSVISEQFDVLMTIIRREFRIRYKDSMLGFAWVFGAPLLMIATYSFFVFGIARPGSVAPGVAGLASLWCCLGFWQWMSECMSRSTSAFHDNSQLVKRTRTKHFILPLANVAVSSVGFGLPLMATIGAMIFGGVAPISYVFLACGLISLLPWLVGGVYLSAVVGTFVRDAKHAVPICMNVGMFLSPVLYSREDAPRPIAALLAFNPLSHPLSFMKHAVMGTASGLPMPLLVSTLGGAIFLVASLCLFASRSKEFPDVV